MEFVKRILEVLSKNNPYTADRGQSYIYYEVFELAVKAYNYGLLSEKEFNEIDSYDDRLFKELMK